MQTKTFRNMSPFHFLTFFLCFILLLQSISATNLERILDRKNCSMSYREVVVNVGGVINLRSRVGKEQKVAMELAVQDFYESSCYSMVLHLKDSSRNSDRAASAVVRFVKRKQVQVNMGIISPEEAAIISEFNKFTTIVSLAPTANSPLVPSANLPFFIQMSNDISIHTQCIAAIVGQFRWRKVTTIYEQSSSFSSEAGLIAELSHSLQRVKSSVDNQNVFPPISSLSNPSNFMDTELMKLKNLNNRVFVILKCSVDFAVLFFERAKQMGMMGNGYVWIVSDDISSLLDSLGQNVIANMQGVIGFRSNFVDSSVSFKEFKLRFQKKFRLEFPEEEHSSCPSIYALRAYDATWMIAKAMESSRGKNEPKNLTFENILAVDFDGLSGIISFKYRRLAKSPTFQIVNVIGKSYREVAMWSPELGLSQKLEGDLGSIYWPGGEQAVPIGWTISINDRPLKIGVPANGAFTQFVKVSYNQNKNETYVAGFSIDVFEAAVKQLPYNFSYVFVPNHGSYDELVVDVANNKSLDAAVGDMEIMADRYKIVTFSQPYMESGLVMVVTVKPGGTKERFLFLKAFSMKMWLLMAVMSFSTGFVVWLTENVEDNPDFGASSASHHVGRLLWFSVTVLFFVQRETIKSNVSRFVLATWFFVVVVVTACFTANLTSIITVQRLEPSVVDIEYLLRTNAAVGCNGNSFIVKYLINVLHFKPDNIKRIRSINDYPEAFEKREISAAFFVAPHAKVFLAEYCHGYTVVGPSFKLGGFGFVFPKDSPLAKDMSEAILKVTESGHILELEKRMLRFSSCLASKTSESDDPSLGPEPFSGLFIVTSCVSAFAFFISVVRIPTMQPLILSCMQTKLVNRRVGRWTSSFLRRNNTKSGFPFSEEEGEANNPNNFVVARQSSVSMELAHNQS